MTRFTAYDDSLLIKRSVRLALLIASRIKVMAALDIAETRLPQDGRIRLTTRGRDIDVRVSTSPTAFGESIVLRLLGRSEVPLELERLGLPATAYAKLVRALERPHGIILLTGPTGSGKTTTLYATLSRLRRPEVKILTVEVPVEVLLEGVNQVQVRPEIGLSYADTLRAFLRQDPDILMIGEIRDKENRRDRAARCVDRPSRALDPTYQQHVGSFHAPDRHRDRTLSVGFHRQCRHCPATHTDALHRVCGRASTPKRTK